jgi:hypothetical protein
VILIYKNLKNDGLINDVCHGFNTHFIWWISSALFSGPVGFLMEAFLEKLNDETAVGIYVVLGRILNG